MTSIDELLKSTRAALEAYLEENSMSKADFAKKAKLPHRTIYSFIAGDDVIADTLRKIQGAMQ